jgi:uncharacterized protein (DUF4415 family)
LLRGLHDSRGRSHEPDVHQLQRIVHGQWPGQDATSRAQLHEAQRRPPGKAEATSLPGSLQRKLGVRGPQKAPTKERITIRRFREVVERFLATGDGWLSRVVAALQGWLEKQKLGSAQ